MEVAFLLVIVIVGAAVWFWNQQDEEQKRTEADEAARREAEEAARRAREEAERQRHRAEQEFYLAQITALNKNSIEALEATPQAIAAAEQHLDRADEDFAEGAYAPFWDSVERAAAALGAFHESVLAIKDNSSKYAELAKKYHGKIQFAVSPKAAPKLKIATATSSRMNGIVRQAQRKFEFSMIYEQRKTNQILVAGFRNLAQALAEMTWRITSSVDELAASVDRMGSTLEGSLREIHSQTEKLAEAAETYMRELPARTTREEKVLAMLDNIQRKRHPSLLHSSLL